MTDNEEHALSAQVQRIDQQLTQVAAANAMNTAQVLTNLDAFRTGMNTRFDRVDERLGKVEQRLDEHTQKLDEHGAKLDEILQILRNR